MVRGGLFAKASKKIEISLYNVHFKSIYSIIADMVLFLEFFFCHCKRKGGNKIIIGFLFCLSGTRNGSSGHPHCVGKSGNPPNCFEKSSNRW